MTPISEILSTRKLISLNSLIFLQFSLFSLNLRMFSVFSFISVRSIMKKGFLFSTSLKMSSLTLIKLDVINNSGPGFVIWEIFSKIKKISKSNNSKIFSQILLQNNRKVSKRKFTASKFELAWTLILELPRLFCCLLHSTLNKIYFRSKQEIIKNYILTQCFRLQSYTIQSKPSTVTIFVLILRS